MHDVVEEGEDAGPVVPFLLDRDAAGVAAGRRYLSPLPQSFVQASKCRRTDDREADEDELRGVRVLDGEVWVAVRVRVGAVEDHLQLIVREDGRLIPVQRAKARRGIS